MEILTYNDTMHEAVSHLIRTAFTATDHGYDGEVELTDALRISSTVTFELVAFNERKPVGYAMLSVATINSDSDQQGLVLAPLSVAPEFQNQGVGSHLMQAVENLALQREYQFISILGSPDFYHRFGYTAASRFGIQAPMEIPDEFFMLKPMTLNHKFNGMLNYAPEFGI